MAFSRGAESGTPDPSEQDTFFREGVRLCMLRWTALQLAVENQWGGRSSYAKAKQLENDVVNWFYQSKGDRYLDELEDILDETLLQSFNTEADDGSITEVAEKIMDLYEACAVGNFDTVRELQASSAGDTGLASSKKVNNEDDDDDDDDDSEEEDMDIDPSSTAIALNSNLNSLTNSNRLPSGGLDTNLADSNNPILSSQDIDEGWEVVTKSGRKGRKG